MVISIAVTIICGGMHVFSLIHTPEQTTWNPGQITAAIVIITIVLWALTSQVIRQQCWALTCYWIIEIAAIIASSIWFKPLTQQGTLIIIAVIANLVMIAAALILFLKKDARQWLKTRKS